VLMSWDESDPEIKTFFSSFMQGLAKSGWTDGGNAVTHQPTRHVELVLGPIDNAHAEIERAFEAFAHMSNGGLLFPPDINTNAHRDLLITLTARHRLPAVYSDRLFVVCFTPESGHS
jgi:hypothetical protein